MNWLEQLGDDNRGSRPRCVLLMDGEKQAVAERMTRRIVQLPDQVIIADDDKWMPRGIASVQEARLGGLEKILSHRFGRAFALKIKKELGDWWNPNGGNTPNWDIACSCSYNDNPGLLLIEAKAHGCELKSQGKKKLTNSASCAQRENHLQIGQAVAEAAVGLQTVTGRTWKISRDRHYQISNRFAWSWKLAKMGIPVILLYLGFLDAEDMADDGPLFRSKEEWERILKDHCRSVVDNECWGKPLNVNGTPLLPLIQAHYQPFQPGES